MPKTFDINDCSPLADDKNFILTFDGPPGADSSVIVRNYLEVADAPAKLVLSDGSNVPYDFFNAGDTFIITFNSDNKEYRILNLVANKATSVKALSNGSKKAGFLSTGTTDVDEPFICQPSMNVGFGSSEDVSCGLSVKGQVLTGLSSHTVKMGSQTNTANAGIEFGDSLFSDVAIKPNLFFGYGSETQQYQSVQSSLPNIPVYSSESLVEGSKIVFTGTGTLLGGSTQSELDEGTTALVDLYDTSVDTSLGRYRVILVDNAGDLNWFLPAVNVTNDFDLSKDYIAGVIGNTFSNSVALGHNAHISGSNQVVLGTVGINGDVVTDYNITTTGTITGGSFAGITLEDVIADDVFFNDRLSNVANGQQGQVASAVMDVQGEIALNGSEGNYSDVGALFGNNVVTIGSFAGPAQMVITASSVVTTMTGFEIRGSAGLEVTNDLVVSGDTTISKNSSTDDNLTGNFIASDAQGILQSCSLDRLRTQGFFIYENSAFPEVQLPESGAPVTMQNDGAGPSSTASFTLPGVTNLWDTVSQRFDFSELSLGDIVKLRLEFQVESFQSNSAFQVDLELAEGTASSQVVTVVPNNHVRVPSARNLVGEITIPITSAAILNNPARVYMVSDKDTEALSLRWSVFFTKTGLS